MIEDVHGSVLDAFTLHKPKDWLPGQSVMRNLTPVLSTDMAAVYKIIRNIDLFRQTSLRWNVPTLLQPHWLEVLQRCLGFVKHWVL